MIPLVFAQKNTVLKILKITTDDRTKRHLENLSIIKDEMIEVISSIDGNLIIKVKNGRLALNKELASKIYVG